MRKKILRALAVVLTLTLAYAGYQYYRSTQVSDESGQSVAYIIKEGDELFSIKADRLNEVDKMVIAEGELFGSKTAAVRFKNSSDILVFKDIKYNAFAQYFTVVLEDYLKATPSFDYSVTGSLSGIGARFGVDQDPVTTIAKQKAASLGEKVVHLLGMMLFFGLIIGLMMYMQNGAITSTVDKFDPKDIDDDLDDLVGMDDIKQELLQLEEMVKAPELYKEYGISKTFNVMMTGEPGTGKTKIARCLAKRLGIPLFYASAASLESGYVGGGPRALKKLYKRAMAEGRAIIFLDEAEGILLTRQRQTNSRYENDTATTLLSLLDGVNTKKDTQIIWIVASNFDEHKMVMDSAMLRRFQLKTNFRLPNHEERREILRRLVEKRAKQKICATLDLDHIAGITNGMSPATLETIIARASLSAVQNREMITQDVLLKAFERVAVGLTDRATTDKMTATRRTVAIHEAGHFLVQVNNAMRKLNGDHTKLREKLSVIKISTESVSKLGALGFVLSEADDTPLQTREDYESKICELYGGMANEEIYFGAAGVSAGAHNDIEKVTDLLDVMYNKVGYYQSSKINYARLKQHGVDSIQVNVNAIEDKSSELYADTRSQLLGYRELSDMIVDLLMDKYVMTIDEVIPHLNAYFEGQKSRAQVVEAQPEDAVA